jgi:DNA-binding MarR family transcriptional regulator
MHTSSPPPASPCHCANLRRAARAVSRYYDAHLAPSGLTVAQYSLLRALSRLEPATAGELGAALGLDRTTLVRNLRPLTERHFVAEAGETERRDRRAKPLVLTPAGRHALEVAEPLWRHAQHGVAEALGPDALAALLGGAAALERLAP